MNLLWPEMLWLLVAMPVLVAAYVSVLRRRKRHHLRYPSLVLVKGAVGVGQRIRRHVPPALLLIAMLLSIVGLSRPSAVITLPSEQRTIVLALDVSLSMSATDIEPNRLVAAQAAARRFIEEQPADVLIGIVSFAGTASLVQAPTGSRDDAIAAVDRLLLDRHTAIGSAIIVSLATIFPQQGLDLDAMIFGDWQGSTASPAREGNPGEFQPTDPGSYMSAAIVLLTDGRNTTGPHPIEAARLAAERGVRVYTVGFGTAEGATVSTEGWSMYMRFDEDALSAIAELTHAEYFHAGSAADLHRVYRDLTTKFVLERTETELTALLAAAAAFFAVVGGLLSLLWFGRHA